jgi:hypothetical protein
VQDIADKMLIIGNYRRRDVEKSCMTQLASRSNSPMRSQQMATERTDIALAISVIGLGY